MHKKCETIHHNCRNKPFSHQCRVTYSNNKLSSSPLLSHGPLVFDASLQEKAVIVPVSKTLAKWGRSSSLLNMTVIGSTPTAKDVIVANAYNPQSDAPACLATFINCTWMERSLLCTSCAMMARKCWRTCRCVSWVVDIYITANDLESSPVRLSCVDYLLENNISQTNKVRMNDPTSCIYNDRAIL